MQFTQKEENSKKQTNKKQANKQQTENGEPGRTNEQLVQIFRYKMSKLKRKEKKNK